jgi:hypothetical protein
MQYDPLVAPDPQAWLSEPEAGRLGAVLQQHMRTAARVGNLQLHAAIHTTVETQIAERYANSVKALERLVSEGLDRHEAIHAIGTAVAKHVFRVLQGDAFDDKAYGSALDALDAETWRQSGKP